MQNAIVFRAVRMVAEAAASVPLLLYEGDMEIERHPLLDLLARPNPVSTAPDLLEAWYGYLLVSGNAYLEAVALSGEIRELHALRPDRMKVVPGPDGWPEAYEYATAGESVRFAGEVAPGVRPILHVKLFHPVNDHYGLSPLEAAATAIDIHNTASRWNKALLDNSARPSGALVYTARDGNLSPEQYERLKSELEAGFQGAAHAGRPLLLEGGLDWKSMSLTPKDMDFIEAKHVAAREIALALGVPPMLLGIPGDNTYSNFQEATRTLWRQTVLPLAERTAKALSSWLAPAWGGRLDLRPDLDRIEALGPEREALWSRLEKTSFLTRDEKRAAIGYAPLGEAGSDALRPTAAREPKFNPHHDDLGRFTFKPDGEGDADVIPAQMRGPNPPRFIRPRPPQRPGVGHNQGPPLSEPARPAEPMEPRQAVEAYRSINNLPSGVGTVAYGEVDGKAFIGVNSSLPGYTEADRAAANAMRDTLIAKYPEEMATENVGQKPNDALYHAEATALLRAARETQGSLSGRSIELFVDRPMCPSCDAVLPLLSREIGNPLVVFRDSKGNFSRLRNGMWE
ncbi:MAG: phage portal protein [Hyphomicrobiaceae bacterium]|nr:phage portal protein [Hyphomicrobiaceae bacterium]